MRACLSLAALTSLVISVSCTVQNNPIVVTTSGILRGAEEDGVISFKGIPFGEPPVGDRRWEAPAPFLSVEARNATALGPACLQQFPPTFRQFLSSTPVESGESEDCLFLNVWAPAQTIETKMPVVVWIYGGFLAFGTASQPEFDGTSFAKNQGIVVVTFNYRTNVFGFPGAEELFPLTENLGFFDQDLAFHWVQANIAAFGGDPQKVTIMGESSGGQSVAVALQRHSQYTPFRAAIMQSAPSVSTPAVPNFTAFDSMANAVNCTQTPGPARLSCLKSVPASVIHAWANSPQGQNFTFVVDNFSVFPHPFQRIQQKMTARVPILLGVNQDDGSVFTVLETSLPAFLMRTFGPLLTPNEVRALYPGLNDTQIIPTIFRDFVFLCPTELTSRAFVQSGMTDVFRYVYGAVFADLQIFPGAGAWHTTEIGEIFGTFNASTATPAEKTLSHTMQTAWANFIKDPVTRPAPNWERFLSGNSTNTLARLAFNGNVQLSNLVEPALGNLDDGPCDNFWNAILDV